MSNDTIDTELVEQVKAGNKGAFDVLVLKYQNKLFHVVNRYVQDPNDALDVVQESFIKAYRAIGNFRGDSSFYTWLYRIAVNTAKNHITKMGRRPPHVDIEVDIAEQSASGNRLKEYETPEGFIVRDEVEQTVAEAMEKLPEELRVAITLREIAGLSYAEIAKVMKCPLGTVRSRIFRARELIDKELKKLLKKDEGESHE